MNGKQLRNSILQWAISGRLVPQDPNDEPAIELLKRINPKAAPLSSDDAPFPIPDSWCWCKIKDVCLFENGYAFNSHDYKEEGTPIIRISDMVDNKVELNKCVHYQGNVDDRFCISKGDLLIALSGATTGKMGVYLSDKKAYLNQRVGNLKVIDTTAFLPGYRNLFMQSKVDEILKLAYGGAQPNISGKTISDFTLPLPPLAEQERIVRKVEELLPLVERYDKAQTELDRLNASLKGKLRTSVLQEAIAGRLVPQDSNDEPAIELLKRINPKATPITEDVPFSLPDSWCWCRMQDVIEFINGRAYKKEELLEKGKYKVLRVGNFFTNSTWYYSDLELADDKYCNKGDLLYAWSASFGPRIWTGDKTIFHYHIWNVKFNPSILYRDYLYYFLLYDKTQIKGSTTGSTMVHVSMENMKPRPIPLPPLAEQERIVQKVEELFAVLDALQ